MKKRCSPVLICVMFLGVTVLWSIQARGQEDIKETLFKSATKSMSTAREAHADILAPKNYTEAMKYYGEAESDFKKGRNLDGIRKKLNASVKYFTKAIEATKLAEVTFTTLLKARSDAQNAEAPSFATEQWQQAEAKFSEAARELEEGDVNSAKRKSQESEAIFRRAELDAIKANYLNETWSLLKKAEEMDVRKYAPKTLARSQSLVSKAETELTTNRYDTDVARDLARQAKYEINHALYLANVIKKLRDDKDSLEDYILATEKPLAKIAATMDIVGSFEKGFAKTTNDIISYVQVLQDSSARLTQDLAEREDQIEILTARVAEMENKLGGIEQEKSALAQRMEAQARIRQQFESVEKMFDREEAIVLRDGNDVIIRLIALNFRSGSSTIEPEYFSLLTRLQQAIGVFPESELALEGHTDSFGSDEANLKLSQQRAEAVRHYILANMGLDETRVSAVGYGESKPIANNETVEGRARNRRIEVVIHPHLPQYH